MADQKVTDLTEDASPATTDLLYVVVDPAGTPLDRKVQIGNLPGGASPSIHRVGRDSNGTYSTTSTTRVPIDSTNLGFQTVTLAVGDLVKVLVTLNAYNSGNNYNCFDVEVDQPTSANLYVGSANDRGLVSIFGAGGPFVTTMLASFVATEAGTHGFRPVWFVTAGTGNIYNAASGDGDNHIEFVMEKWPAATVF